MTTLLISDSTQAILFYLLTQYLLCTVRFSYSFKCLRFRDRGQLIKLIKMSGEAQALEIIVSEPESTPPPKSLIPTVLDTKGNLLSDEVELKSLVSSQPPAPINRISDGRLGELSCKIVFENNPDRVYYAGDAIVGNIYLNIPKRMKVRGLSH